MTKQIKPYQLPSSYNAWLDRRGSLKLDWNEGSVGPPPSVINAIQRALKKPNILNWYPDIAQLELRKAIGKFIKVSQNNIICSVGSDGLLDLIAKTFIRPGDLVSIIGPTYDQFRISLEVMKARLVYVYGRDPFTLKMEELTSQINLKSRIIYLVNPNNPTGVIFKPSEIEKLLKKFSKSLLLVDEAYIEFCLPLSSIKLIRKYKNLLVLRSFSKAFCLAGVRLGYLATNRHLTDKINQIRNVKEVNIIAQIAATAALRQWQHYQKHVNRVNQTKEKFAQQLVKLGYSVNVGEGNFLLVKVTSLKRFISFLRNHKIYIRDCSQLHQLNKYARITIGTPKQMAEVLAVIKKFKS